MVKMLKFFVASMVVISLVFGVLSISIAGNRMEYVSEQQVYVASGAATFIECAQVTIKASSKGYVVVTASGMASFDDATSVLILTLATASATGGSWVFAATPGTSALFQTYTVRMVFPVEKGLQTFYLNGISYTGSGGDISVETGSMTAKIYKKSWVKSPSTTAVSVAGGNSTNNK
jgi:hypothetical protein